MKFLLFNVAVIAALCVLFSADKTQMLETVAGSGALVHSAVEAARGAQPAPTDLAKEPIAPATVTSAPPRAVDLPGSEDSTSDTAPRQLPRRAEPERAMADAPASPDQAETPVAAVEDAAAVADRMLPISDPAVLRRRNAILTGLEGFDTEAPAPASVAQTPAVSTVSRPVDSIPVRRESVAPSMSPTERARSLDDLARDMELMYAEKLTR
jgi:hypothetical protein